MDLLDTDLSSVDASFPMLAPGLYDLKVNKSEFKDNAAKTWSLELETTTPATSSTGEALQPGVKLFHTTNTAVTGKSTPDIVKRGIAQVIQGAKKDWHVTLKDLYAGQHKQIEGCVLRCQVGTEPGRTSPEGKYYGPRNTIVSIVKKA